MSINMALLRAFCSSWALTHSSGTLKTCGAMAGLCSITQHALSPARQNLGHLSGNGAHLLVLHEVFLKGNFERVQAFGNCLPCHYDSTGDCSLPSFDSKVRS